MKLSEYFPPEQFQKCIVQMDQEDYISGVELFRLLNDSPACCQKIQVQNFLDNFMPEEWQEAFSSDCVDCGEWLAMIASNSFATNPFIACSEEVFKQS